MRAAYWAVLAAALAACVGPGPRGPHAGAPDPIPAPARGVSVSGHATIGYVK